MVEWVDSCSQDGWLEKNSGLTPSSCVTVGMLLLEDAGSITVVLNKSSTGSYSERIAIPKSCIKRVRYLEVRR